MLPLIIFLVSLLHCTSRESVFKVWLVYSGLGLILFLCVVVMYLTASSGDWFRVAPFTLLGIAYIAGSLLIWLYGAVTHFLRKEKKA